MNRSNGPKNGQKQDTNYNSTKNPMRTSQMRPQLLGQSKGLEQNEYEVML